MLDPVACEIEGHHRHGDAVLLTDEAGLAVNRALHHGQTGCPVGEIGGGPRHLLAALDQLEHSADQAAAVGDRGGAGVEQADEGADVAGFPGLLEVPDEAEFELIDLRDYPLPHLDEPLPPSLGQYQNEHTRQWAEKIASFDGFVIVTPEYNHSTSGVLKNAIDYLYAEWNNKAVGFVSYGGVGGARAAEHLRLVAGELQMADVRQQVALSLITEFENFSVFKPNDYNLASLDILLDQVIAWSNALAPLRQPTAPAAV